MMKNSTGVDTRSFTENHGRSAMFVGTARWYIGLVCLVCFCAQPALAERIVSAETYRDQLEGMWIGQLMGNYAGRQVEGLSSVTYEGDTVHASPISITNYTVQWSAITQGLYYAKNSTSTAGSTSTWQGDDDTSLEFLYANALQSNASPSAADRTNLWQNNLQLSGLYIANRQAWYQIHNHGQTATTSGSVQRNMQAGWSIDSQITTESLGAICLGMRQRAVGLTGDFGGITNQGYPLHAAQFYAAMYADAPFASSVTSLIDRGLQAVPTGSWTREIVSQAKALYDADAGDGNADNWLASRNAIIAFAHQRGRDRSWVESASNTGLTTLAILYGGGDFMKTVELGVQGGEDSDCNPATAGGLIGMMRGADAIRDELTAAGYTVSLPEHYNDSSTVVLSQSDWTMAEVLDIFQTAAETQIVASGGSVIGSGATRQYSLVDSDTGWDMLSPGNVSSPTGPRGVVGDVLAAGGDVSVIVTRDGVALSNNAALDRSDQSRLIDGEFDVSSSGVLPFWTSDGGTAPQTDGYEIHFDREILFDSLTFHEGDIRYSSINGDPATAAPYGGFFDSLQVQVWQEDTWVDVESLTFSEELDPLLFFQSIDLSFTPVESTAIRIIGDAGGTQPFTSATEIEVFGTVPEPASLGGLWLGAMIMLQRRRRHVAG